MVYEVNTDNNVKEMSLSDVWTSLTPIPNKCNANHSFEATNQRFLGCNRRIPRQTSNQSAMGISTFRLLFILSMIICSSASNSGDKVSFEIYYETLCPYCSNLIVNYLYKLFDSGLDSITDLKLIPYGNAKIKGNGTITCQHGEYECVLNTVEACAIDAWPDVHAHFPFVYCVESLVYENNYTHWETCFEKLNLDPSPVLDCYNSERGTEIELRFAAQTSALEPPHKYVPWVVVDGEPLYDDYRDFISYICKAYKGTHTPSACKELSLGRIRKVKMELISDIYGKIRFKV